MQNDYKNKIYLTVEKIPIYMYIYIYIGNNAISSSKKHIEKTNQDSRKNANKRPHTRSSKINTRPQFFDQSNVSKNTQRIPSQRICKVNARVHDPPRCYKSDLFSERETDWDDTYPTASQQSAPYSLDHRTTASN